MNRDKQTQDIQVWIDSYSLPLLNRAIYLLSDKQEAKDLVQDVFLAAWQSYDSYEQKSNPRTWLTSILNHKVADFYRKKYRSIGNISLDQYFDTAGNWKQSHVLSEWADKDINPLDDSEFNATLHDCLDALPSKWRIPIQLYYLEGKKSDFVCQELGITTTNLWKILQRGRLQLRECLDKNWFKAL